ncbi:MAG: hypothetical protein IPM30_10310 [Burkholderiales bacterium]|nr:hypothetical protein [Burkholderiales bacterium]
MKRIAAITLPAVLLLSACGGGGGSGPAPVNPQPSSAVVQVNLGDDPADRLLAASMTVNSLTFTNASGASVSVLSAPRSMEMLQSMGTVTPLAVANVPQGTYTSATMTFGEATVTYVDPATGQVLQKIVNGPMTASFPLNPALAVGSAPMVVNLDMNMGASVVIDANGNVTLSPSMTAATNPLGNGSSHPEDGGIHGMVGMVSGTSGGQFTLAMMQGMSGLSLMTNANTQFHGMSGMGMMTGNMLVSFDASLQPDGTWMATRVQSRMGAGGAMSAGMVTEVSGNPPTQLVIAMQNGIGNGMAATSLAGTTTVNIDESTQFSIDGGSVDLTDLPFTPYFDRASLSKGQRIEAFSTGQMMQGGGMNGMRGGTTLAAVAIQLGEQGLRGTVANYSRSGQRASFTLTLPADSAFAKLTGAAAVTVYQQPSTQLRALSTVANGNSVVVRGLLFVDNGIFRLVADRVVGS